MSTIALGQMPRWHRGRELSTRERSADLHLLSTSLTDTPKRPLTSFFFDSEMKHVRRNTPVSARFGVPVGSKNTATVEQPSTAESNDHSREGILVSP